jgi:pimeloyl-ACP methyl ester carboxylesterase
MDRSPRAPVSWPAGTEAGKRVAMGKETDQMRIDLLGGLVVRRNGEPVAMPASRKARALLAFLILTGKPQHRERLCDLFWDAPDDPRGALRSALSRLRPLVNDDGHERLIADRERVRFDATGVSIDYLELVEAASPPEGEALVAARAALDQPLLAGLDLPNLPEFQAWLTAVRHDAEVLRARLNPGIAAAPARLSPTGELNLSRQRIGFAKAADGTRIAWARIGDGPPLIKAANWLNHLELDWHSPIWSPLFQELARDHCFIRYDERGNGLSDWGVPDLGFEAFVTDLACVVDASGHDRFPLLGLSQGVAVAIEYAARYPERVSHLLLWGGYAAGWRVDGDADLRAEREAVITLVAHGWGRDDPSYRQIFSRAFLPSATADELAGFDEFQRRSTSPANAARFLETFADIDVRHRLKDVRCPTLVMHASGDRRVPVEKGTELAAGIAGAEFVTLPTENHLLLGGEPCSALFVAHVRRFLAETA